MLKIGERVKVIKNFGSIDRYMNRIGVIEDYDIDIFDHTEKLYSVVYDDGSVGFWYENELKSMERSNKLKRILE